jgi:short-subunit dehydrogenase
MKQVPFALITGSSSGIGRAIAEELASRNHNVLLIALPGTGLHEVVDHVRTTYGVEAFGFETDLTSPNATQHILEWIKSNRFNIRILVNNAGFGNLCALEKTNPLQIASMIALNNQTMVMLTRLMIPELKRYGESYLMNVGSLASFLPLPNKALYAATKSFVYAFSAAMRIELRCNNIHVSCLCPGGTRTSKSVMDRIESSGANALFIQSARQVAIEAVNGMLGKKFRIIPGWHNRIFYQLGKWLPEGLVNSILIRLFSQQNSQRFRRAFAAFPARSLALAIR